MSHVIKMVEGLFFVVVFRRGFWFTDPLHKIQHPLKNVVYHDSCYNKNMDNKAGALVLIGIIAACIGIPLLLSRHNSNAPQHFLGESSQKPTNWVKAGRTYSNSEHWHISWDLENLIPTDIEIKRLATET